MKLRIRGNSIRLRLLCGEVAALAARGKISETINFGASKLIYTLKISSVANDISASFVENEIIISLPEKAAKNWMESNQIGLETTRKISETETLKILVEKDFVCLDRPNDVDNREAYPHPPQNC